MAQGKKTGGRDFEPGHPGIGGRPALTEEQKQFKKLTTEEYIDLLSKYMHLNVGDLEQIRDTQKDLTILESYILNCFIVGSKKGDYKTLELMLNRVIGKPAQPVTFPGGLKVENELSSEELRTIGKALMESKGYHCE